MQDRWPRWVGTINRVGGPGTRGAWSVRWLGSSTPPHDCTPTAGAPTFLLANNLRAVTEIEMARWSRRVQRFWSPSLDEERQHWDHPRNGLREETEGKRHREASKEGIKKLLSCPLDEKKMCGKVDRQADNENNLFSYTPTSRVRTRK